MKKLIAIISLITIVTLNSCLEESNCDCQVEESCRRGAICNDGTTSSATGQGACSSHGGVDEWLCD